VEAWGWGQFKPLLGEAAVEALRPLQDAWRDPRRSQRFEAGLRDGGSAPGGGWGELERVRRLGFLAAR